MLGQAAGGVGAGGGVGGAGVGARVYFSYKYVGGGVGAHVGGT